MFREGDQIGPYVLRRQLGRGGFGSVWLGERVGPFLTTSVAVKFPLSAVPDLHSVRKEARLWAKAIGHPNILNVIEVEVYEGQVVFVSEYADGGSLRNWIDARLGAISISDAVQITEAVLSGLSHLHSKDIIHRDLKPANVLLQGNTPKIADFGLSRVLTSTTHSQNLGGTPVYMAPEAWNGERTPMTDIWSAGVIFYELITSQLPFNGNVSVR